MDYLKKKFSVAAAGTKDYRDNWERTFADDTPDEEYFERPNASKSFPAGYGEGIDIKLGSYYGTTHVELEMIAWPNAEAVAGWYTPEDAAEQLRQMAAWIEAEASKGREV